MEKTALEKSIILSLRVVFVAFVFAAFGLLYVLLRILDFT